MIITLVSSPKQPLSKQLSNNLKKNIQKKYFVDEAIVKQIKMKSHLFIGYLSNLKGRAILLNKPCQIPLLMSMEFELKSLLLQVM